MNKKRFSIVLTCLIALFSITYFAHAQEKITGPWLWMIAPTEPGQGGAASIDIDSLAVASNGAVTEADVAANGAREGDTVGNYAWTLGQISATGEDNINECLNRIGLTDGNLNDHSSYALFTFKSDTAKNSVPMLVGSSDAIKVWLNGEVVHNHPINRVATDFKDTFPINLVAGENLLLVKVSQRSWGWSMFVGIETGSRYVGIETVRSVSSGDGLIQDPDMLRPIVYVVYHPLPDSPPRANVDAEIDALIKKTQRFFADEMERHGYGRKTFQIEVDTSGNTVVHRAPIRRSGPGFVVYMDDRTSQTTGICGLGGHGGPERGGARIFCWNWRTIAHELGHAFGLNHDFRTGSDNFIMSYGSKINPQLSKCAAEWLNVYSAFNPGQSTNYAPTEIEMLPPTLDSPPNAIRLRFKITDPHGFHQVQLLTPTFKPEGIGHESPELISYKSLNGRTNATVEFVTTHLTPNNKSVSLRTIDVHGNFPVTSEKFPINVASLLPRTEVISIPDANLAAAVRQALKLSSSEKITTHAMLDLSAIDAPNSGITDLTGLEHAHNLRSLNLGAEHIWGEGSVNSNKVSDFSPLIGLTTLTDLNLSDTKLVDVSALSGLTNLTSLGLNNNNISDISALSGLTNLNSLYLGNNNISDISTLSGFTYLTWLELQDNNISDISALSALTNLTWLRINNNNISDISTLSGFTYLNILYLSDNNISDISALSALTNLTSLYLQNNNIPDISALSGLTYLNSLYLGNNNISDISALSALTNLTWLYLQNNNISDISALSTLKNLTWLELHNNNILDISALSTLKNLQLLYLSDNNISDISALSALTNLIQLRLYNNNISDISALLALNLTGTQRDSTGLSLWNNPLSYTSINTHIPAMQANGIEISFTHRTPTKLLKISGDAQKAVTNSELPFPFVVEVQDQRNRAFAEVTITFSITNGSGKLSTLKTITDTKGRAKTRLTLGQTEGETTIRVTAAEISQPIQFTVKAILPTSFVQLPDTNLTAKITEILGKPTNASITAADMLTLTSLTANNANISDLTGLQQAPNLTTLRLDGNNLSTIDSLTGLTQLTTLSLDNNNLSNIDPLVELAQLETLSLENNNLSDVAPLVELTKLKTLRLRGNLLDYPSLYTTIPTLRSSGVDVVVDTRTPTTLINIPGTPGVAGAARQVLVEIQDQNDVAFAGVPVTFTLTAADGHLSTSEATSNRNGTAITTLTLGPEPGENVVSATVTEIQQPLTFTITTIDVNTLVHIPDVNLKAKIAETLNKPKNATLNAGDLSALTGLDARNANIQNLTGIEYAHNLSYLNLGAVYIEGKSVNSNTVSDWQPLSGLTNLTSLHLFNNNISDISALSALTNLNTLWLQNNNISDVSALQGMTQLTTLYLHSNNISDISALSALTRLNSLWLQGNNISDVSALQGMTQLTSLYLHSNNISDISALSALTSLNTLWLQGNNISDVSALQGMTQLTTLHLSSNNISDISPLLALNLTGTSWDSTGLSLRNNPLSYTSVWTHIPAMQARGIVVSFNNITHPEFVIISGDKQEELVGRTLPSPFVVEYRDADGKPKEGVNVTFSIVDGEAELTDTTIATDADGRAQTFLQLGMKLGTITVRATADGINTQLTFTASVILPENHVPEDVNADGVVDAEDLALVAAAIDTTSPEGEDTYPNPDVNGDGVVNSDDLALVMAALETTPTAPAAILTVENLQRWIDEAKQLTNKSEIIQRGITVLEQLLAAMLPKETALLANYPNPFNPETWIPYHLAKPTEVTVHIYAVNGTLIRTLALGHKPAGIYEHRNRAAYWDGRNTQGERVASGIYFYTLTTDNFTATRKMLIRK